jgi:hypothetical protein
MFLNCLQVVHIEIPVVHTIFPCKSIIALLSIAVRGAITPSKIISRAWLAVVETMNVTHCIVDVFFKSVQNLLYSNKYQSILIIILCYPTLIVGIRSHLVFP